MKISLYWSALFLVLSVKIVAASVRVHRSPMQYCGSQLADVVKMLCNKKYSNGKRSQPDLDVWDYKDSGDYNEIEYPYRSGQELFMPSRALRISRSKGIVEECCKKPCYISELKSYCEN